MKKVLFTATVDSHILQFHLPFLKLFKEKGYEVHVATNGNEKIPYCDIKHIISFEISPLKINNLKAIKQLKEIINEEKFDIIHCHTPMGGVVTRLAARKARKKYHTRVIYTAHGFHFYKGAPKLNWMIYYPIEKWLAKYTDTLITINNEDYELAKNKFSKRFFDIQYVPGVGIDEDKFNFKMSEKEKIELRKSLGLTKDDFVLTCIGRLDKNKNQGLLIEVVKELFKSHPNIHLLLVGPDENEGIYHHMALGFENNIHFLGYRDDISKILKITNISLSASFREGLPVNVLEAMASGVPVIAANCRGVRELIKDEVNGYIVENNVEDFLSKILKIYNNENLYKTISKNNLEQIFPYYLKEILKNMSDIYFRKKKILHILSSNQYSGAENVACTIINKLKNEYEMYYCSPNGPIKDKLTELNINYIPLEKLSYSEIKKVVNRIKPDVIHAHDNKATVISSIFHNKCKVISHIHGNNKIMNTINIKTILFNICSKHIDKFIWVSDSSLNGYCFNKKIENKSIVLYNVIDQDEIIRKSKLYKVSEEYDACFLGRLGYPKNALRLIEIVKELKIQKPDISISIVGDGPERKDVETKIKEYDLEKNIKMYGFQSNPYPILNNSKILVMTSIYEGTPMCALEAMALGKPIVATPVDGLLKIVKNGYNGYLSNKNDEIVNKIIELILNKKIYDDYVHNVNNIFLKINDIFKYIELIRKEYKSR